ncbi:type IV pilin protein [Oceanicoccus sp. KOV_DT_Chl]|uniref:type IV pilin protein n=1 Tax=Oceanicoccus sp. KOV_DT_Chl TaxID=1904639 RepID=UPI000C7AFCE3|nr:prepilin-type N-terminal cleavage/methylation domain-containing protein [Oceanicoccus sp. KOV_DT_Chl]
MFKKKGFSLIELMLALAIVGVIYSIAFPSYAKYQDRADVVRAVSDLSAISQALERHFASENNYPNTLAEFGWQLNDPWGNPYYYTNIAATKGKGALRKDKNLVPINADFDLYSAGKDGETVGPLTAKSSRDDVIRAGNGAFFGLAEDY